MKKIIKTCFVVMLIVFLLLQTGCWSHRELNEIGVVSAIGLDRNEQGNISLSVQVITPVPSISQGEEGGKESVRNLSSSGETFFDAVRNLMTISGDRLFYTHMQVIIIGEDLAREGVQPILDFLERDPETRLLTWVLLTEGKAEKIVRASSKEEKIPAMQITRLIKDYGSTSKSIPMNLLHFSDDIYADGIEAAVGKIEYREEKGEPTFHMIGGGAFKEDRLVGWLDAAEARGYLWVHDDIKSGIITAPKSGAQNQKISFEIIRAKSKIKPILEGDKLSFVINIKVTCNLGERVDNQETSKKDYAELEKLLAQAVIEETQIIVDKAQKELKSDILGFGRATKRKYPDYWNQHQEEWDRIFPNLDVEIIVEALLADHGIIR